MVNEFNGIEGGVVVCWSSIVGWHLSVGFGWSSFDVFCLTMIGETEERQMERRNKNGKEIKWANLSKY